MAIEAKRKAEEDARWQAQPMPMSVAKQPVLQRCNIGHIPALWLIGVECRLFGDQTRVSVNQDAAESCGGSTAPCSRSHIAADAAHAAGAAALGT